MECEERAALELLDQAAKNGSDISHLMNHSKQVESWKVWKEDIKKTLTPESIETEDHIDQLQYAG